MYRKHCLISKIPFQFQSGLTSRLDENFFCCLYMIPSLK
jgi:hypothetical protein